MWKWVQALDGVLRGEATRPSRLRDGEINIPLGGLTVLMILLGAFYGFCMGWFALFNRETPQYTQLLASTLKVPALFLLTLLVTLPSLYVFNALVGSRLGGAALLRLLVASLSITLVVLASFGPIVAFFSVTTTSYPFMKLLNVVMFAVAGTLGLRFLLQTMHRLTLGDRPVPPAVSVPPVVPEGDPATGTIGAPAVVREPSGALEHVPETTLNKNVRAVFAIWVVVFGLVGAQMSWVLRPFIGDPNRPFEWWRSRESNFFESVVRAIQDLSK